jgi:hypothetical protein
MAKSIANYIRAAANFWLVINPQSCSIYRKVHGGKNVLHPFIADHLATSAAWQQPRPRKATFTALMFVALSTHLASLPDVDAAFLSPDAAVHDWTHLGCFTSSRVSEYAPSSLPKGQAFAFNPLLPEAGAWGGFPIAFIYSDFTLLDHQAHLIHPSTLMTAVAARCLAEVQICFHFDKSPTNFITRKFSATGDPIFDPPALCCCIHHHASPALWHSCLRALGRFSNSHGS